MDRYLELIHYTECILLSNYGTIEKKEKGVLCWSPYSGAKKVCVSAQGEHKVELAIPLKELT